MNIRRLTSVDEALACCAVNNVKPEEDRHGNVVTCEYMKRFLGNDANHLVVAYEGDTVVGYAVGYRLERVDRDLDMMYLHEIEVEESNRGKGIGKQIINELIRTCRADGYLKMFVITDRDNHPAVGLYRSTGAGYCGDDPVVFNFDFDK